MSSAALSVHHGGQALDGIQAGRRADPLTLGLTTAKAAHVQEVLRHRRASSRASSFALTGGVEKVVRLDVAVGCGVVVLVLVLVVLVVLVLVCERGHEGSGWAHALSGWAHVGFGGGQGRWSSPLLKKPNKPVRLRAAGGGEGGARGWRADRQKEGMLVHSTVVVVTSAGLLLLSHSGMKIGKPKKY